MRPAPALALALLLAGCSSARPRPDHERIEPPPGDGPIPPMTADLNMLRGPYGATVARIVEEARRNSLAYPRLQWLCDRIGHRLSGSEGLDRAIEWTAATMRADGLDAVRTEKVMVPKWVRGHESVDLVLPRARRLRSLALGNSVGRYQVIDASDSRTPPVPAHIADPIEADVVVARDWAAFEALGDRVKGKIVLFHHPMKPYVPGKDPGYGESVDYRVNGASRAAAKGAVAALVCSATARSLGTPHTGTLRYAEDAPKIPAAALSPEDSEMILRLFEAGEPVRVRVTSTAHFEEDVPSANVVGEIRGSEKPDEVVVFGGHLDSWDVGQGAHDDGGPVVACMEAMRILRSLGLKPRRTIRVVLFTNEENGLRGGKAYAKDHEAELPKHVAALETDSGCFRPLGFGLPAAAQDASPEEKARVDRMRARLREVVGLLEPWGAGKLEVGGGGADISPMAPAGVPQIGLEVDMATYFDIHHTDADTFDKVVKEDLDLCAGVLAATVFVLADMPEPLRE